MPDMTHAEAKAIIHQFADDHPMGHSIHRDKDHLHCRTCNETVYAPVVPAPPPGPMEGSLSRFD